MAGSQAAVGEAKPAVTCLAAVASTATVCTVPGPWDGVEEENHFLEHGFMLETFCQGKCIHVHLSAPET